MTANYAIEVRRLVAEGLPRDIAEEEAAVAIFQEEEGRYPDQPDGDVSKALKDFDPREARDERGRWTTGSVGGRIDALVADGWHEAFRGVDSPEHASLEHVSDTGGMEHGLYLSQDRAVAERYMRAHPNGAMMHIAISPDATFVQWEQAQAAQQRALIEAARAGDIPRLHAVSLVSDWARNEGNADVLVDSEGHWILLNPAAAQAEVVLSDGKSKDFDPGQRRDEHGRWVREGFHFASDDERRARVIPPAWTHVQINDDPTADLQVWGVDAKGRSQYRYSAAHTERQAKAKFQTTRKLNGDIQRIDDALARAAVVGDDAALGALLIARTGFRPGSEDNTGADEQAYGVSTLMAKHVKVKGDSVHFDFTGKSGHRQVHKINDPQLARLLGRKLEGKKPGEQVFDSSNVQMRDRLKREAPEYKLKDLRTRIGTVIAIQTVNSLPVPKTQAEFKKARNQVGDAVSGVLGNTRAVALASYVDPTAFAKWQVALIQKGGE